MISNNLHII